MLFCDEYNIASEGYMVGAMALMEILPITIARMLLRYYTEHSTKDTLGHALDETISSRYVLLTFGQLNDRFRFGNKEVHEMELFVNDLLKLFWQFPD